MDFVIDIETAPQEFGAHTKVDDDTGEEKDIGAFSPHHGRVTALGWKANGGQRIIIDQGQGEKDIIKTFLQSIEDHSDGYIRFVGFSVDYFDLYFLRLRCLHHGIELPDYNGKHTLDLRTQLNNYQRKKKGGLDDFAELIGIDGKPDHISGEDAPYLWKEGEYDELRGYLKDDLRITHKLFLRMKDVNML
jgi:predicted PolB exonuclease-like 3'-5' exonuclease